MTSIPLILLCGTIAVIQALQPQPLPPGRSVLKFKQIFKKVGGLDFNLAALQPQPLPPRIQKLDGHPFGVGLDDPVLGLKSSGRLGHPLLPNNFNLPTKIGTLTVAGTIHMVDNENRPDNDEISDQNVQSEVIGINKFETFQQKQIADKCVGGEVRAIVKVQYWFTPATDCIPPDTITVKVSVNLYEGVSCNTWDFEDYREQEMILFADSRQEMFINVPGNGGGSASLRLSLSYEKD